MAPGRHHADMADASGPATGSGTRVVRPVLRQVVVDTTDARALAEFYRELLGWDYREGDEAPAPGHPDPLGADWLVLRARGGGVSMAFQQVDALPVSTWPRDEVPQQMHLDMSVSTREDLDACHQRVLSLGAREVLDRTDDPEEPLRVYADPAGHPFCIFVAA